MAARNKNVLRNANAAISRGDNEAFLAECTEDILWTTVGEGSLRGKAAVREWMKTAYARPPIFTVNHLVGEDDYVVAIGEIQGSDENGARTQNAYSDVWRFRDGKMAELMAFVVLKKAD